MQKNEERIAEVTAIGSNGEGIIKDEGLVVFVPFALQGEKVKYKVLKVDKKCVYGKLIEVITPSKDRVSPPCGVFNKCGGCSLQHVRYEKQLEIKENNIKDCFRKIANIDIEKVVLPAVQGESPFRYRNKLQLPVGEKDGKTVIGFYAENSHRIIPIEDCLINAKWTKTIISIFSNFFERFDIKGYDDFAKKGDVREITVKEIKGNLIIVLVVCKPNFKYENQLVQELKENLDYNFSLFINVNESTSNVIYGEEFKHIYGEKEFSAEMLGVKYKIGVLSFMQVNTDVCQKLYSAVKDNACLTNNTVVIDAYSGAGLMTALLGKSSKKAYGIEIIKEAVECANQLVKENGLDDKITNYNGKCEVILPQIMPKIIEESDDNCLILDPPRKGCDVNVLNAVIKSKVKRIIYVSCLPSSLARDVGLLTGSLEVQNGEIKRAESFTPRYKIKKVQPFDMFSNTKHVETLCVLTINE